jgi:hypothetical protein
MVLVLLATAAPATASLQGAGSSDMRSYAALGAYVKGEPSDGGRGASPANSGREGPGGESKPASVVPRNRRPESWAPWEDVNLRNYKPIQVGPVWTCALDKVWP